MRLRFRSTLDMAWGKDLTADGGRRHKRHAYDGAKPQYVVVYVHMSISTSRYIAEHCAMYCVPPLTQYLTSIPCRVLRIMSVQWSSLVPWDVPNGPVHQNEGQCTEPVEGKKRYRLVSRSCIQIHPYSTYGVEGTSSLSTKYRCTACSSYPPVPEDGFGLHMHMHTPGARPGNSSSGHV